MAQLYYSCIQLCHLGISEMASGAGAIRCQCRESVSSVSPGLALPHHLLQSIAWFVNLWNRSHMSPWFSSERWSCESCVLIKNKPNPSIHQPVKPSQELNGSTFAKLFTGRTQTEEKEFRKSSRSVPHSQAKCQGNARTVDLQQHCTDQLGIHWSAKISSSTPTSESQPEILPQHGLAQEKRSTHKLCRKWSECLQMPASAIWPLPSGRFPNDGEEDHAEIDLVNVCEHLWIRCIQNVFSIYIAVDAADWLKLEILCISEISSTPWRYLIHRLGQCSLVEWMNTK